MEWNVVVTTRDGGFDRAEAFLDELGEVARTGYYNVLVMRVDDPRDLVDEIAARAGFVPDLLDDVLSRVVPADRAFSFDSPAAFRRKTGEIVREWAGALAGASFHVRFERRGFGERLSSAEEERRIGEVLHEALEERGTPGSVDFDDPDVVVAVESVSNRAGLALLSRDDREAYPFLAPE